MPSPPPVPLRLVQCWASSCSGVGDFGRDFIYTHAAPSGISRRIRLIPLREKMRLIRKLALICIECCFQHGRLFVALTQVVRECCCWHYPCVCSRCDFLPTPGLLQFFHAVPASFKYNLKVCPSLVPKNCFHIGTCDLRKRAPQTVSILKANLPGSEVGSVFAEADGNLAFPMKRPFSLFLRFLCRMTGTKSLCGFRHNMIVFCRSSLHEAQNAHLSL